MKYYVSAIFFSAVLFIIVNSTDVTPKNDEEKQILQFFLKWRSGDSFPFSLPSLNIIKIPPLNGSYSGKGIQIKYSSNQMQLVGLNTFSVVELNVSLTNLRASGSLNIPTLKIIAGNYELQGKAFYVYKLKGFGKLDVVLNDVSLQFEIGLNRDGNGTKVTEILLDFSIADIQGNLENSSWAINKLLDREGLKILNGYHEDITRATKASLIKTFDKYLAAVTPAQLLSIISR